MKQITQFGIKISEGYFDIFWIMGCRKKSI